jgi:hypothetical protein
MDDCYGHETQISSSVLRSMSSECSALLPSLALASSKLSTCINNVIRPVPRHRKETVKITRNVRLLFDPIIHFVLARCCPLYEKGSNSAIKLCEYYFISLYNTHENYIYKHYCKRCAVKVGQKLEKHDDLICEVCKELANTYHEV